MVVITEFSIEITIINEHGIKFVFGLGLLKAWINAF